MIGIARTSSFIRAYDKLVKGQPSLELLFRDRIQIFSENPFDATLKTHKLGGKLKELWAFSLNRDLRIVFRFVKPNTAVLENIGTHDDVY